MQQCVFRKLTLTLLRPIDGFTYSTLFIANAELDKVFLKTLKQNEGRFQLLSKSNCI